MELYASGNGIYPKIFTRILIIQGRRRNLRFSVRKFDESPTCTIPQGVSGDPNLKNSKNPAYRKMVLTHTQSFSILAQLQSVKKSGGKFGFWGGFKGTLFINFYLNYYL